MAAGTKAVLLLNETANHFGKHLFSDLGSLVFAGLLKQRLLRRRQSGEIFSQWVQDRVGNRLNLFRQIVLVVDGRLASFQGSGPLLVMTYWIQPPF